MKKKYQLTLGFILAFLLILFLFFQKKTEKKEKLNLFYFDTYIEIKFNTKKSENEITKI